jgi:hypothetical protein
MTLLALDVFRNAPRTCMLSAWLYRSLQPHAEVHRIRHPAIARVFNTRDDWLCSVTRRLLPCTLLL